MFCPVVRCSGRATLHNIGFLVGDLALWAAARGSRYCTKSVILSATAENTDSCLLVDEVLKSRATLSVNSSAA
jgi:hypothetical protein